MTFIGLFLAIFLPATALFAQDPAAFVPVLDSTTDSAATYTPLTIRESYAYTTAEIFGAPTLFRVATTAAINQHENFPSGWASTPGGYALRVASTFGQIAVRENIAFGVRALDGEDPRYFRSGQGGFWKRTGYALGHTFTALNSKGHRMPAFSLLVADYSAPFIAQQWRPNGISMGRELATGSLGVSIIVTQNLLLEFWPDMRHAFRR